jgi:hypothetical protein
MLGIRSCVGRVVTIGNKFMYTPQAKVAYMTTPIPCSQPVSYVTVQRSGECVPILSSHALNCLLYVVVNITIKLQYHLIEPSTISELGSVPFSPLNHSPQKSLTQMCACQ